MKQIRGLLAPSQVTPTGTRYDGGCDCIQISPDGGTTWNDVPGLDPRNDPAYMFPARTGSDPRCDAAANMTAKLQSMVEQAERTITAFQMATAFLAIMLPFLGEAGLLVDLIIAVGEAIITIGAGEISLAFTSDQWDLINCILYCDSETDGTLTADDLSQILSDIHDQCNSVVSDVMVLLALMNGFVGLSNAGATGDLTGDCSGCNCAWCYEWDFTLSDGGWTAVSGLASYSSGNGWQTHVQNDSCSNHAYLYLLKSLGLTTDQIERIEFEFTEGWNTPAADYFDAWLSGGIANRYTMTPNGDKTVWGYDVPTQDIDQLGMTFNECDLPSALYATKVRVKGHGDVPAFTGGGLCP